MQTTGPEPSAGLSPEPKPSDSPLVELLRREDELGIGELARRLGVTATAVRQRLDRLIQAGIVRRALPDSDRGRRGRPAYRYGLTEAGRRLGGDNFRDLALVLWRELREVRDPDTRRGLLARVGSALAGLYRADVGGATPRERLDSVAGMLRERRISCAVDDGPGQPGLHVLTTYSCPYPDLAEHDRGICAAERSMLEELVGAGVRLDECRLDGGDCCRFTATDRPTPGESRALENVGVAASNAVRFPHCPPPTHPESDS